jgi:hypothetical protein
MLWLTIYKWRPENRTAIIERFAATGGAPLPEGVKRIGRWSDLAGGRGFTVTEANDPTTIAIACQAWSDLMSFEVIPVMTDEQLKQTLSALKK